MTVPARPPADPSRPPTRSGLLGAEHPQRDLLAAEVHARPSEVLETPCRATYVAKLIAPVDRAQEIAHLAALCDLFAVVAPSAAANHFTASLGPLKLRWERHGEFSGYTFIVAGQNHQPFSEAAALLLPAGWLAAVPGQVLVAVHAEVVDTPADGIDSEFLARHFGANLLMGGNVGDGAGMAFTDFQVHADSFSRILLVDRSLTARQTGRMLQRLFEIEVYRMMALLALPIARQQSAGLAGIEGALDAVTTDIASGNGDDEALLQKVTRLAAEVESGLAASQFRFGACAAYAELVNTRIADLREARQPGIQPISEFMTRRFVPAVATCAAVSQRMRDLSERVARASALLSTRVDIARERQNQALLGSMDRRARAQLRLQQTVEGLSVAAIVYYAAGLVGYLAKGLKSAGAHVEPDLLIGASIPLLVLLVVLVTRRARHRVTRDDPPPRLPG